MHQAYFYLFAKLTASQISWRNVLPDVLLWFGEKRMRNHKWTNGGHGNALRKVQGMWIISVIRLQIHYKLHSWCIAVLLCCGNRRNSSAGTASGNRSEGCGFNPLLWWICFLWPKMPRTFVLDGDVVNKLQTEYVSTGYAPRNTVRRSGRHCMSLK